MVNEEAVPVTVISPLLLAEAMMFIGYPAGLTILEVRVLPPAVFT